MAADQDQSSWLPEPPPPRPARRDSAIEAALRQFDRVEEPAAAAREPPGRSWASAHRPQFAVLVAATLLIVVGIPAALIGLRDESSTSSTSTRPSPVARYEPAAPRARSDAEPPVDAPPRGPTPPAAAPSQPVIQSSPEAKVTASNEPLPELAPPALAVAPPSESAPVAVAAPPPPPPPSAVASADSGAQETADEIVVSGTPIAQPALTAAQGLESKTARAGRNETRAAAKATGNEDYAVFLSRLQAAVRAGDRRAVTGLIGFPLRVNTRGSAHFYRNAPSVQKDFDRIFTVRVRRAILRQRADQLFVRDLGAMIGDGEVWFDHVCANTACSRLGPVRITAVNR